LGTAITVIWNLQQLALQNHKSTFIPASWLDWDAIFPALAVSVVSLIFISFFTASPRREQWAPFFAEENQEIAAKV
jgi:hypothetical protein